tara:strand:+ start:363 stop:563 length:201 start_codon:yes stop_codon:yes gene_type:complete
MIKKSTVTCICNIIVDGNEYEALTEVDKMLKKEYTLSEKATLIIVDTVTTSAEGCGINGHNNKTKQ